MTDENLEGDEGTGDGGERGCATPGKKRVARVKGRRRNELQRMRRILERSAMLLVAVLVVTYAGDWGVLQVRMARHTAFSSVQVDQFVAASIKGNKQEYFHAGTFRAAVREIDIPPRDGCSMLVPAAAYNAVESNRGGRTGAFATQQ